MKKQTLTIEETAKILGVGRNACYEAARKQEIPTIRLGRRILVPRAALERKLADAGSSGSSEPTRKPGKR